MYMFFSLNWYDQVHHFAPFIEYCKSKGDIIFDDSVDKSVPRSPGCAKFYRYILPAQPDVLFSNLWWRGPARSLLKFSEKVGVPNIIFDHAVPMFYLDRAKNIGTVRSRFFGDSFFVWGKMGHDYMTNLGCDPKKLKITGYPWHDTYLYPTRTIPEDDKKAVLFLSSHGPHKEVVENVYRQVEQQCRENNLRLFVRAHPRAKVNKTTIPDYQKEDGDLGCGQLIGENECKDDVYSCDLVVTPLSSCLLDAYYYKKPIICCNNRTQTNMIPAMDRLELPTWDGDLMAKLHEKIDEDLYARNVEDMAAAIDGNSSKRCYEAVKQVYAAFIPKRRHTARLRFRKRKEQGEYNAIVSKRKNSVRYSGPRRKQKGS